MNKLLIS
jgi:uncharacterized protein YlxW (UPF0749 family)